MKTLRKIKNEIIDIFFQYWFILLPICAILCISIGAQFVVNGCAFNNIFTRHLIKIVFSIVLLFGVAFSDKKMWLSYAYPIYCFTILLLVAVAIFGTIKLGAQRWVNLYFISLQPSEMMKCALILCLARYYSVFSDDELRCIKNHIIPIFMIAIPMVLILKQPDLGTAILLAFIGGVMLFAAGVRAKYVTYTVLSCLASFPFVWNSLKTYQRNRVLTFLNPDRDPLGNGYHILQSKIAIGSGGLSGKGIAHGTQVSLNFLPEKNTDFIFTAISEEVGFIGALAIISLFMLLVLGILILSKNCKTQFGRFVCVGAAALIFFHTFINISMVLGIVPVVGIPIPFISYGGSSLLTCMIIIGIVLCTQKR